MNLRHTAALLVLPIKHLLLLDDMINEILGSAGFGFELSASCSCSEINTDTHTKKTQKLFSGV